MFKRLTVSGGLTAFAALWFALALWKGGTTIHAAVRYESVTATLVDNQSGRCSKSVGEGTSRREVKWECFFPLVAYDVAGQRHSTVLMFRTSESRYPAGSEFDIWVNPEAPLEPMEAGVRGWVKPVALAAAGLIVLLFAYLTRGLM